MANNDLFVFKPGEIVKRPFKLLPYGSPDWEKNATWFQMKARKISDQNTSGRGGTLAVGEEGATFMFLAPKSFGEDVGHTWEEYESMASRLANKVRDAAKLGADISSLKNSNLDLGAAATSFSTSNFAQAAENLTRQAYNSVAGSNIPKVKIDTPLYYSGSTRRQLQIEVELVAESRETVKRDVIDIVQDLMRYSSPGISSISNIDFEFPYYFEVKLWPSEAIKYTTAALIAVQPTYGEPWINGYPTHCKLQLTFKDISPLFRTTITHGSVIHIIGGKDNARPGQTISNPGATKQVTQAQKNQSAHDADIYKQRKNSDNLH